MIRTLYTLLLLLATPLLLPGLYKNKPGKPSVGQRWKEHFGRTPPLNGADNRPTIWVHAVSVGEVIAAAPLIKQLAKRYPQQRIVITTTTPTGAKQAEALEAFAEHRYMPLDFRFAVHGFIKAIQPKQLIVIETELWPNTLSTVNKAGIPVTVVNARLSEKSFLGYRKVQWLFNQIIPCVDNVVCQHVDDAERFHKLGFPKEKLSVSGSIKFDITIESTIVDKGEYLRETLGTQRPIWIAASTHQGEDEQILEAHKQIVEQLPNALLILVPRHPERFQAVEALAKQSFQTISRTSQIQVSQSTSVYLGDTMGEMLVLMGASDVCFIGGSLLGKKVGGHNVLEPAALGKPILTGPSYFNFADITYQLMRKGCCQVVSSSSELSSKVIELLQNTQQVEEQGQAALNVVEQNRGALKKTIEQICENVR